MHKAILNNFNTYYNNDPVVPMTRISLQYQNKMTANIQPILSTWLKIFKSLLKIYTKFSTNLAQCVRLLASNSYVHKLYIMRNIQAMVAEDYNSYISNTGASYWCQGSSDASEQNKNSASPNCH